MCWDTNTSERARGTARNRGISIICVCVLGVLLDFNEVSDLVLPIGSVVNYVTIIDLGWGKRKIWCCVLY
jgi:hypothetical protein